MRFFTFCHQILSILTIGANIGSCRDQFSPSPRAFSISRHFRTLRPHAGLVRLFFIICGHFDRGCFESSARSHYINLMDFKILLILNTPIMNLYLETNFVMKH